MLNESAIRNPDWLKEGDNTKRIVELNFSDGELKSFDSMSSSDILIELLRILDEKGIINDVTIIDLNLYEVKTIGGYSEHVYATSISEAIANSTYSINKIMEVKRIES